MDPNRESVRPIKITKRETLKLIQRFLPCGSSGVTDDEVDITRSGTGMINEVYFVKRKQWMDGSILRPDSSDHEVVIRKYNDIFKDDPSWPADVVRPVDWAIISQKLQHLGLGPEVYGVFPGGRIEEKINCRSLTVEDANKEYVWKDVARILARIHSLDMPFARNKHDMVSVLKFVLSEERSGIANCREAGDKKLAEIAKYDFDSVIDLIEPTLKESRIVFGHNDLHLGNIVMLSEPRHGSNVMILDFDTANYGGRCQDLGLFLLYRSGCKRYDTSQQRDQDYKPFLEFYLDQFQEYSPNINLDKEGRDSIDNLITESLVGGLACNLVYLLMVFKFSSMEGDHALLKTLVKDIPVLFQIVLDARDAVCDRLKEISDEKPGTF